MDFGNEMEHFSLKWTNFNDNMKSGFHDLLQTEDFVDVTIAAEGKLIQAHKMVLSVCSPYFKNIFKTNPCQHPVIFLKDVTHKELSGILQFMYLGEVSVQQEELGRFLKTAEALQIKGLTDDYGEVKEEPEEEEEGRVDEKYTNHHKNDRILVDDELSNREPCVKKLKVSSDNEVVKSSGQSSPIDKELEIQIDNHFNSSVGSKNGSSELEQSDVESDKLSIKEESASASELLLEFSDISDKNDTSTNSHNSPGKPQNGLSKLQGDPNEPFVMTDGNKEIRFVMSPRMRPCLVFNDYLYIKDHVGVASPGQSKTIYWRCKDITCKARCIQTSIKLRLKRNTYHQHEPNVDPSYFPIKLKSAYDVIKYLQ